MDNRHLTFQNCTLGVEHGGLRRRCGDSPIRPRHPVSSCTQLKQAPMPQAIGLSSDTWQGRPSCAATSRSGLHHRFRAAADERGRAMPRLPHERLDQVGHQSAMPQRAVFGGQLHLRRPTNAIRPRRPGIRRARTPEQPVACLARGTVSRRLPVGSAEPRYSPARSQKGVCPIPPATITRCSAAATGQPLPSGPQTSSREPRLSLRQQPGHLADRTR